MSQHLITQFITRTYIFKPFNDARLVNQKLKKYQASNRKNNISPEDVAESTHPLQAIKVTKKKSEEQTQEDEKHIDLMV